MHLWESGKIEMMKGCRTVESLFNVMMPYTFFPCMTLKTPISIFPSVTHHLLSLPVSFHLSFPFRFPLILHYTFHTGTSVCLKLSWSYIVSWVMIHIVFSSCRFPGWARRIGNIKPINLFSFTCVEVTIVLTFFNPF